MRALRILPRLAVLTVGLWAAGTTVAGDWGTLPVPGTWETDARYAQYDGVAWYRCTVSIPEAWKDEDVYLLVEQVDNAHEVWLNGRKIGGGGRFPPDYANGLDHRGRYRLDAKSLRAGRTNLLAVRVYDHDGRGGFKGPPPQFVAAQDAIVLKGHWQFRTGDDLAWAREDDQVPSEADAFRKLVPLSELTAARPADGGGPLTPEESLRSLQTPDDLALDLVLAEPLVAQPVFLTFDARGRMWVVQYRQYPHPAGLKMLSRDQFWRAVYDRVPLPPPHGERGRDRITIHEDSDGDGVYDRHTTFVDGLNIATACLPDRDGVWVLNAPYLLFYPDRNGDDRPDGDPVVHLEGFGLEDTHSVVNSLCYGPDGWIYAAQGSTVTGNVRRPGEKAAVPSQGQLIWRYHPQRKQYEIFAEGGGNAFGVAFDAQGRVFSGHNGGDTRGFHYHQGAYLQKGFSKHGPLSNPYAFGYFPPMAHHTVPRFTHTFVFAGGTALPDTYRGRLFGVAPLLNHVVMSEVQAEGSTFRTRDVGLAVDSRDPWFRPVDIKAGPDGALYIADWYDGQTNHYRNHEGQIDASNGRIYRLRSRTARPVKPLNMAALETSELIRILTHPEQVAVAPGLTAQPWHRRMAVQLLQQRDDPQSVARCREILSASQGEAAWHALWACAGHFGEADLRSLVAHAEPQVRCWAVRLLGDLPGLHADTGDVLARQAQTEPDVEVRAQLACTARRLTAPQALEILRGLWTHAGDADDPRLPLLGWWAVESHAERHRDVVLKAFESSALWNLPIVARHIIPRLMRRFATAGTRHDLQTCAALLRLAPTSESAAALLTGFEEAFRGRAMGVLPEELVTALEQRGGGSLVLAVRLKRAEAITAALRSLGDSAVDRVRRIELVQALGDVRPPAALEGLSALLKREASPGGDAELLSATVSALAAWNEPAVAATVLEVFARLPPDAQGVALAALVSRAAWTTQLLKAVDAGALAPSTIPRDIVRRMTVHRSEDIARQVQKHWGEIAGATTDEMQREILRLKGVAQAGAGSPYAGKAVFRDVCGKCHRLHGQGGQIGPDLTTFKRDDLDNMLLNIVNPSAEIREGFETWLAADRDGRITTGFLIDQDPQTVVLRGAEGQTTTLTRSELDDFVRQPASLMPEGLMKTLTDQQVRDLLAYLRSTQPLND